MNAPKVRQISVPTTIAGGEFSANAGVTNTATKVKESVRHPLAIPRAVILDPAITLHTPDWLFLSTGIRAVDHCVEGLCSNEAHPYADAQALKGLSMLAQGLPRVKADPNDLDARMDCQIGTWLSTGGLTSGVPMGASHGIGYVLGAAHRRAARLYLLRDAAVGDALEQAGQRRAPEAGGRGDGTRRARMPATCSTISFAVSACRAACARSRLRPRISTSSRKPAMATPWVPRNPRKIDGPADVREILELAA